VSKALTGLGARVVQAENGAELIERLADEGPFDLVVTDVSMPWMSGLEAMYASRLAGLAVPVIVMTALAHERIPTKVRALGGRAVLLRKPFDLSSLKAAVTLLLNSETPNVRSRALPTPIDAATPGTNRDDQWADR
jgi:two-component system cell cycle sensor histidine kinase/response regulator CckA